MSVVFPKGFSTASIAAGISAVKGKKDLAIVVNNGPLDAAAGVFTSNRFCAAPVQWSRKAIADGHLRGVVINSGCANACTGQAGYDQAAKEAETLASLAAFPQASDVAVCSTGMIGDLLPLDNLLNGMKAAYPTLASTPEAGRESSIAILTTDTHPKTVEIEAEGYRIGGMVKGSGMIAPQLATMICVITTDAVVTPAQMKAALEHGAEYSFNRIDVDGCMSTNDTVLLLASGASGVTPDPEEFAENIAKATASLARQIVGDGEGSSHDIRVRVTGATSEEAALACARAVAASNLLKCAICGNDPNWGRVVSSLGIVPEDVAPYDPNDVTVDVNDVRVCDGGKPGQPRDLVHMEDREVHIDIDLNTGSDAEATVWTDDLTHEYIHINADYES